MKHVTFKPEITLGNIVQIIVMLGCLISYIVNNEHRMSVLETTQKADGKRIDNIETAVGPMVNLKKP